MTSDEIRTFQEDWEKNWNPSLDQPKEGGVIGFLPWIQNQDPKKLVGYGIGIFLLAGKLGKDSK